MRRSWGLALIVSTTLSLTGCGKSPSEAPPVEQPTTPPLSGAPQASGAPQESSSAPDSSESQAESSDEPEVEKYVPASVRNRPAQSSSSGYPGEYSSGYPGSSSGYDSSGGSNQRTDPTSVFSALASLRTQDRAAATPTTLNDFQRTLLKIAGINPPNMSRDATFQNRASAAFSMGRMDRAYDLLVASALAGDEKAVAKVTDLYRWNRTVKRPVLGSKIAIGMNLENTANLKEFRPVGTTIQVLSQRVTRNRDGQFSSSGSSDMGSSSGASIMGVSTAQEPTEVKLFQDATGELSSEFFKEMNKFFAEGTWGDAFKDQKLVGVNMPSGSTLNPNGTSGMPPGSYPYPAESMFDGVLKQRFFPFQNGAGPAVGAMARAASDGSLIPSGGATNESSSGYPGTGSGYGTPPGGEYGSSGYGGAYSGASGGPYSGGYGSMPGMGGRAPNPVLDPSDVRPVEGVSPVSTALDYIGNDSQNKLIIKAYEKGYDVLVIFEVEVTHNRRSGIINNTGRIKAISVAADPKEATIIGTSKPMNSIAVAKARQKEEDDGLVSTTGDLAAKISEATKLVPIPANLTGEAVAKGRLPRLLKESTSKLTKLGEVLFYYDKGYIDEAQRDNLYREIVGSDADALISGSAKDKKEAISRLLAI